MVNTMAVDSLFLVPDLFLRLFSTEEIYPVCYEAITIFLLTVGIIRPDKKKGIFRTFTLLLGYEDDPFQAEEGKGIIA